MEKETKNILCNRIEKVILFILLFIMNIGIGKGAEVTYQTFRDFYNYGAIACFFLVLLLIRKAKVWRPLPVIISVVYITLSFLYFYKWNFEAELFRAMFAKCISIWFFLLLLIDLIVAKKIVKWKERNIFLTVLFLSAIVLSVIISPQRKTLIYVIFPFVIFYFVRISLDKWKELMLYFSTSMWLSVTALFVKSLIAVPYTGERYLGTFLNISTAGALASCGVVCAFYWLLLLRGKDKKTNILRIFSVIALIISLCFLFMVNTRTSEVAVVMMFLFGVMFWGGGHESRVIKRRILTWSITFIGICLVFILGLWGVYHLDIENMKDYISNETIYNNLKYWIGTAKYTFGTKDSYFGEGTILSMLDSFTSGRIAIWAGYLQDLNWFGHPDFYCLVNNWDLPHNTYIGWLFQYGIIGGLPFVVWFIGVVIFLLKKSYRGDFKYLFAFLWIVYAGFAMGGEYVPWIYPLCFFTLIIQYPVLVHITAENND
ncbi:MAG: hypothetical protein J6A73_00615 [Lachnospiraceae bacterium]|nr:hypothetical protein [Lachnospiraceae bacterium]